MTICAVTRQAGVTLRKDLMPHLGVQPGNGVAIDKLPDGSIEIVAARRQGIISDAFDRLKRNDDPSLSLDDMNAVNAES